MEPPSPSIPFRSFWHGGFEGACQKLCTGERVDMLAVTQHRWQLAQDYQLLRNQGIYTAHESLPWHSIDRGESFDFSSLTPVLQASKSTGIQVIWTLCHYGWPDDLDIFRAPFVDRFARYCRAAANCISDWSDEIPIYNPINEISFLAWAAAEAGFMYPCLHGRAIELKQQLVRAAIAGCEAIWDVDPRARILHTDPVIQVIAPPGRPDLARHAHIQQHGQFEAWDMLGGWDHPELGGHPRYLDLIGINFYHDNQWELERARLSWEDRLDGGDKRWLPFHALLENVYQRYLRPIYISETSHFGVGRGPWIRMIAEEVHKALTLDVPVTGICLYPILDRPDWHNPDHWHHSGLWEVERTADGELRRVLNQPYQADLQWAQAYLGAYFDHA